MAITSSKSGTISITRTAIVLTLVSIISVTQAEGKKLIYYKHRHQVNTESLGLPREWHSWKSEHGKSYLTQKEELERHVVWQANKKFIETHNVFNETFGYTLGMNEFGDMTEEEYQAQYTCVRHSSSVQWEDDEEEEDGDATPIYTAPHNLTLPEAMDWHTKGAVSSVMNQGECCSSYAFSAIGAVEGAEALASGMMIPLSVQNIIDCSSIYGNHGCLKGDMESAFQYAIDMGGVDTRESYPYEGTQGRCRFKRSTMTAAFRSYQRVSTGSEHALQSAVALQGPIAIAMDALHNTFRFYQRGVYDEPHCSTSKLTHAMLIIGYGTHNGKDYWLLKNSWGKSWGQRGLVMMARNKSNQCGIATRAVFPIL